MALGYVPAKLKTLGLCLEAVKKDGDMLAQVPENLKTEEMCFEAIKAGSFFDGIIDRYDMLEYVPEALKEKMEKAINEIEAEKRK